MYLLTEPRQTLYLKTIRRRVLRVPNRAHVQVQRPDRPVKPPPCSTSAPAGSTYGRRADRRAAPRPGWRSPASGFAKAASRYLRPAATPDGHRGACVFAAPVGNREGTRASTAPPSPRAPRVGLICQRAPKARGGGDDRVQRESSQYRGVSRRPRAGLCSLSTGEPRPMSAPVGVIICGAHSCCRTAPP